MKRAYKKAYEQPVTEQISADLLPVMYEISLPLAGDGETGGEADSKQGFFDDDEGVWGKPDFTLWED